MLSKNTISSGFIIIYYIYIINLMKSYLRDCSSVSYYPTLNFNLNQKIFIYIFFSFIVPISQSQKGASTFVQPKYLNSPESLLFKKGSTLFGMDLAKRHIARYFFPFYKYLFFIFLFDITLIHNIFIYFILSYFI